MKNLFLLNRLGFNPDLTTRQSRVDSVSIASRYRVLAILLLFLILGVGNAWGDTATNNCSSAIPGTATLMETGTQIKWQISSTNSYSSPVRVYANATVTFTANTGYKITKIVITANSNSYGTAANSATWSASGTDAAQSHSVSGKTVTVTCTGTTTTVTCKPSAQTRWDEVVVTYESTGGGSSCDECTYYVYNGTTWVSIGTTGFDDVVLAPPTLPDNNHGAGNGCWVTDKNIYDGGGCVTYTSGDKYRYVPNPGGAAPDADNKPGSGTCELYAVYDNGSGCLSTTVTAVQCVRIWEEPENLSVTSVTSSGATLNWDAMDGVSSYHVTVTKSGGSTTTYDVNTNSKILTGLAAGTYSWTVAANSPTNDACDSNPTDGEDFVIAACTDISSSTVSGISVTPSKVGGSVSWTAVANATSYEVKVYAGANTSGTLVQTVSPEPTTNSCTITGLSASTQYTVAVKAKNGCSTSSTAGTSTWTTLAATIYHIDFINQNNTSSHPAQVAQASEGANVDIPANSGGNVTAPSAACASAGWTFAGWSDGSAVSETTTAPTLVAAGTTGVSLSGNKSYYAVFTKTESGGGTPKTTLLTDDFSDVDGTDNGSTAWTVRDDWDSKSGDVYKANEALRLGKSGGTGGVTSNSLSAAVGTTIKVALDVKKWSSDVGDVRITVSGVDGYQDIGHDDFDNDKYYSFEKSFVTTTANFTVTIATTSKRAFIDNVEIYYGGGGSSTTYWNSNPSCSSTASVTYDGNGNTGGTAPTDPSSPYTIGDEVTVLACPNTLVKTGKVFSCWNTQADGLGTDYAPSATFTISGDITLYAKWVNPPYTVTFNAEGGTCGTPSLTEASGGAGVTLPSATATCAPLGWSFYGWATAVVSSTTTAPATFVGAAGATYYPTGNVTLHAVYREGGNDIGNGSFTKVTGAGNLVNDAFYIVTNVNNSGGMMYNTVTASPRIGTSTNSYDACDDIDCVWQLKQNGDYWQIYSPNKNVYAAATGTASRGTLMSDGTDDKTKWTVTATDAGYRFQNKYNTAQSVNAYLSYSAGNGYACMAYNNGGDVLFLYKANSGAVVAGTVTYNSNPTCTTYDITIGSHTNGTVTVNGTTDSPQEALETQKITLSATPDDGYRFTGWTITRDDNSSDVTSTLLTGDKATTASTNFTMPAYDVTVSATFELIVNYIITWKVNNANYTTYTGAGTLSTSAESGTLWSALTLPDAPANNTLSACERTAFVGWSTSTLTGDGNSAPADLFKTTSDANATSHSITGNTTFYAVFAKGGDDGSWVVNGSNITAPGSGTGYAKYNGDHELSDIGYKTSQVMPSSSNLQFQASAGYMYNTTAMPSDITSIVLTVNTLNVYEGASTITSTAGLTPLTPTGSGPYTYTFSSGKRYFYLKEPDSGASVTTVTVNYEGAATDYVTSCACSWNIDYITNGKKDGDGSAIWSNDNCFVQVGSTAEWQIEDFTMPNVAGQFWVGPGEFKAPAAWGHSVIADLSTIKYVLRNDKTRTSYSAVSNMIGTLNIWSDGTDDNYHIGIYPDYQITYGVDGGSDPWTKVDFSYISSTTYETDVVTAPTYFAVANFKYYVGVKTTGNTGYGGKSSTVMMNTMSGMTTNQNGKTGKWRMYEDSSSPNWYCAWIPYYVLSYDANGGEGAPAAETPVSSEGNDAARTVSVSSTVPTRDGYTFLGWAESTAHATAGTVDFEAGDDIILTADKTIYAVWAQNFTVTYDLNGGAADPICSGGTYYVGQSVTVCSTTPTKTSSSFLGWKRLDTDATVAGGSTFTMPSNNVTIQAQWETVYFHIYYKEEDGTAIATDDVPQTAETTLRDQAACPGYSFYGWSTSKIVSETTSKPAIIGAGGASYTPTADITVYPVYKRMDGYVQKKDTLTTGTLGMSGNSYVTYSDKSFNSSAVYSVRASVNDGMQFKSAGGDNSGLVTTTSGGTLEKIAVHIPYAASYSYHVYTYTSTTAYTQAEIPSTIHGTQSWDLNHETKSPSGGRWYEHNYSSDTYTTFGMYASATHKTDTIIVTWGTGTAYYITHCELKENVTVTYNGNGGTVGCGSPSNGTVTTVTWDYADGGMSAPTLASSQTICASATREGYLLNRWNTAADGTGRDYAAGATVTKFGGDSTLYAIWDRIYTVTLHDQGSTDTRTQASAGANVTLPGGTPCGGSFTFVGWTESALNLSGDVACPTIVSGAGAWGDDELTDDIDLYAVYSKAQTTCADFATGDVSGAYYIYYDATNYAVASSTGTTYSISTSGTKQVFYIAYSHVKNGYTIRTPEGYLGWNYDGSSMTKGNSTPYYWTLGGSSGSWKFTPGVGSKELKCTSSNLGLYASGTSGKIYSFTKASSTLYYSVTNCTGSYTMTFHDGGGTISGTPTTPSGASWNSSTHVLSVLEDCDKITTFPTASYDGWDFLGWSTEDYSNSGRHTADYAEENGSTDEPFSDILYSTSGNNYTVLGSNVDLYPVFTKCEENEPINLTSGGDFYIYFLDKNTTDGYGGTLYPGYKRVYAGEYSSDVRYLFTSNCASAVEFTFTKSGDYWTIKDKNTNKYLSTNASDGITHANEATNWTITPYGSNGEYDVYAKANYQMGARTDGNNCFMDYYYTNYSNSSNIYHRIYLGTCEERIFSSEPNPVPVLNLAGEPIVTSSAGQTIRATAAMTLTGAHLGSATRVRVTGTNLKFATTAAEDANPQATLDVSVTSGSASATIYVYYTPTATEDGLENIVVNAVANDASITSTTGTVHARHLPANFVIAAKRGDKWYALPANCTTSSSSTEGLVIEVDNDSDPTSATAAPDIAKYGLRDVAPKTRKAGHGERLVFTERISTETVENQKTLYNGGGTSVQVNAQYSTYNTNNTESVREQYEWTPVTSDFKDYQLTSASGGTRDLSLGTDGVFGTLIEAQAYGGKVRLLPATFYTEAKAQVLEWKANSVVVMYTGGQTTATTKIGSADPSSSQTLSSQKITHGVYELTATNLSLTSNAGKTLTLTFGTEKKVVMIPLIITGSSTATDGYSDIDVAIVKNGTLTAAATNYSFRNIIVYGGGKLSIPDGRTISMKKLTLRAGGIATNGSGGSATYEYIYPQVYLAGDWSRSNTNIYYEYITDYSHWYHLVLPFNANLTSITYPQEYYGEHVAANNTGSWIVKRYAGEIRATGNYNAWVDIETESATAVTAGHGYIFWGAPKKVSVNEGTKTRQAWGIQRMTMAAAAAAAKTAETGDKTITGLGSWEDVENHSEQDNDQGWNLIGNPYMANLSDFATTGLHACELVKVLDANDNWTGRWEWNDQTSIRYLTIPSNHFDTYQAKTVSVAVAADDLRAGRAFFVQLEGTANSVTFATANRASSIPALYRATSTDVETGIVMSDATNEDELNFWIKDGKTEEYEKNADYPKTMNSTNFNIYGVHSHGNLSWVAISPEIAEGSMAIGYQVPAAGDYELRQSETYVSGEVEHIYVTDHGVEPNITTDLKDGPYVFYVSQAETNDTRFTVSIKLKAEEPDDPENPGTGIDETKDARRPIKFIYQDKMYILLNGVIYDATGKRVREINK